MSTTPEQPPIDDNALAIWIERRLTDVARYGRVIAGVVVVGLAAMIYLWYSSTSAAESKRLAWEAYYQANSVQEFDRVAERFPNSVVVDFARFRAAELLMLEGKVQLVTNRDAALENINDAIARYKKVADTVGASPLLKRQARLSLAMAHECLGTKRGRDDAKTMYDALAASYAGTIEAAEAKARLERLNDDVAARFYSDLVNYEPKEGSTDLPDRISPPAFPPMEIEEPVLGPVKPRPASVTTPAAKPAEAPATKTEASVPAKPAPAKSVPLPPANVDAKTPPPPEKKG